MSRNIKKVVFKEIDPVKNMPASSNDTKWNEVMSYLKNIQESVNKLDAKFTNLADVSTSAWAEQKVAVGKLVEKEKERIDLRTFFPINSNLDLGKINEDITPGNSHLYISAMSKLHQNCIKKNLKHILSNEIVIPFNIDGTHGKNRLKDYKHFYAALIESINGPEPENQLRKSMQLQKKRHFKAKVAN